MIFLEKLKEVDTSFRIYSKEQDTKQITALCSLDHLQEGGAVFIKNKRYFNKLMNQAGNNGTFSNIGVIFQESFFTKSNLAGQLATLHRFRFYATVKSVELAMSCFSKVFFDAYNNKAKNLGDGRKSGSARVHPSSSVAKDVYLGENVEIEENVTIYPGCVILSNSKICKNSVIYPNVVLYQDVSIGENCTIHANTTIGSDGFSFVHSKGTHLKIWHLGGVTIESDVEIGSNTSIDQGTFSPTVIGRGSKIDNQVHIAHNCRLGKGVLICGQSGLAGSVTIGDYVVIAGAVNIAPHVSVGSYAQIGGMSGVTGHVPEKAVFGGHPARPLTEWLKSFAKLRQLSQIQHYN